jgi:tetratricopeptide (TPR) repeat protein
MTFPWQTLMFGRGDAWQRARVFIQLSRQRKIDVVMLALDDGAETPRPRPWLPAALIDDQLYLFDAELGMPIPGPGGVGIATLEQVRKDKGLLSELDVGSQYPYAPAKADLDKVVALIDASPDSLSRRMKLVDSQRATGQQLILSVDPSGLAERLRQCDGVTDVELWRTPYETWVYREALGLWARRIGQLGPETKEDQELMRRLMLDEWIFDGLTPLIQGRQLHFRGKFEKEGQKDGAKAHYFSARVPDVDINRIETSLEIQKRMRLERGRENDQQWQAKLQAQKMIVKRVKRNASYWLGLIHYETGRYEPAREWLKVHTLEAAEDGPWTPGARYNLSRLYEAMGDLEKARGLLLLDDSPQKHGNLLRARFLRKKLETIKTDTSDQD